MTATATENDLAFLRAERDAFLRAERDDTVAEDEDIVEELVVEEISIDGMCGVY